MLFGPMISVSYFTLMAKCSLPDFQQRLVETDGIETGERRGKLLFE
jgi:hypothetical protein